MDPVGRFERLLESTARRLSGGGIHPIELLEQVAAALRDGVVDGVMANGLTVGLHPRDYAAYEGALDALVVEIEALAARIQREGRFRRVGPVAVSVGESVNAAPGVADIALRFFERETPLLPDQPSFPTRRMRRQHGLALALPDGTRVPVTHTPFTIGRAAGNDLEVPSLAVSRHHAEIIDDEGQLLIRDSGGRNGVFVGGVQVREAALEPGTVVQLGDVTLWVEAER